MADLWGYGVPGPGERTAMPAIDAYDNYDSEDEGIEVPRDERVDHQDVQPGPYFHSSWNDFPAGHILLPRRDLDMGENPWLGNHNNWVWMSRHPADAYYHTGGGAHVYEVEPLDEGPWKWNKHPDWDDTEDGGNRYVSPRARIVRKIEPDENGEYFNWSPRHAHRTAIFAYDGLKLHHKSYSGGGGMVEAYHPNQPDEWKGGKNLVGYLGYEPDGVITYVEVHPDFRGGSIGKAMLDHGRQHHLIHHSPDQTPSGRAWAEKNAAIDATAHRTAGANGDLPEGMTITHRHYPRSGESSWHAHHNGEEIGSLYVMPSDYSDRGAVGDISVHDDYLRRGVGTALWEAAGRPLHTPGQQTGKGQAWAQAVGGDNDLGVADWDDEDDYRTAHRTAMPAPKFPDYGHQLPHVGPMPGTDPDDGHPESWWPNGGCGAMALAFKNMWPDLKIGAEIGDYGDVLHAWVHDGKHAHDAYGTHENDPSAGGGPNGGEINLDVDPQELADSMNIDWSEDEPWEDFDVSRAGKEIEHHWFGYDFDTGEYHEQNHKKARIMTAAVTVYTRPACPQCNMTHKLLDRLGIEHTTVDVTADPDAHAYVKSLGYQQAPVVVVGDGERHWGGFSPDKLKGLVSGE